MSKIDPNKEYFIQEILDKKFIPGIAGYTGLYNLLTIKDFNGEGKNKRFLAEETTERNIKAINSGQPWNKIAGKIKVKGEEIIKFLKIHNLQ